MLTCRGLPPEVCCLTTNPRMMLQWVFLRGLGLLGPQQSGLRLTDILFSTHPSTQQLAMTRAA